MMIKEALHSASKKLASACIEDAHLEAELLLMHLLDIDRTRLYLRLEEELSPYDAEALGQLLERRLGHEPIAYILGHREFFGHDFHVAPGVLIPRAESELLVEKALALVKSEFPRQDPVIADIGTGCGAIAVSLALLLPQARIYATDISEAALKVARLNCMKHGLANRISLLSGDLLDALPEPVDLIVANLPYVRQSDLPQINTRGFEPAVALDGGRDGLEKIRRLCPQVNYKLKPGGYLLLEIGQGQSRAVTSLLHNEFPLAEVNVFTDLSGIDRVVSLYYVIDRQYSA